MNLTLDAIAHPIRVDATGVARIGNTRVTLETVIGKFLAGDTPEEIADAYVLELSDVYATISYYLQHRPQVDSYLKETEAEEARVGQLIAQRSNTAELRQKLLARLAARSRTA
jgi:uncharacterized protein (DUF433 family)